MHRFFLGEGALQGAVPGETLFLPSRFAHQVHAVLHITAGEQLVLFDNSGDELLCTVTQSGRSGVEVRYDERRPGKPEPRMEVILCQGLLKSARFEMILEKGTELGVTSFVPTLCRRSTAGLEEAGPKKLERWQRIIQEAAEQCGRARVPELQKIRPLSYILDNLPDHTLALMPWEEEHAQSLQTTLQAARNTIASETKITAIVIIIGPEGGLTPEEAALAQEYGVQVVTLGTRILRAETAALATVANIVYELGL
jgi:16S rRNA (uracil1498-N3)-methyltransferase